MVRCSSCANMYIGCDNSLYICFMTFTMRTCVNIYILQISFKLFLLLYDLKCLAIGHSSLNGERQRRCFSTAGAPPFFNSFLVLSRSGFWCIIFGFRFSLNFNIHTNLHRSQWFVPTWTLHVCNTQIKKYNSCKTPGTPLMPPLNL